MEERIKKVLFDSSMLCDMLDDSKPELRDAAQDFFLYLIKNPHRFELCVCDTVRGEISKMRFGIRKHEAHMTDEERARKHMGERAESILKGTNFGGVEYKFNDLAENHDVVALRRAFREAGVPPVRHDKTDDDHDNDRTIAAVALTHGCHMIASHDFRDMVNNGSDFRRVYGQFLGNENFTKTKFANANQALEGFVKEDDLYLTTYREEFQRCLGVIKQKQEEIEGTECEIEKGMKKADLNESYEYVNGKRYKQRRDERPEFDKLLKIQANRAMHRKHIDEMENAYYNTYGDEIYNSKRAELAGKTAPSEKRLSELMKMRRDIIDGPVLSKGKKLNTLNVGGGSQTTKGVSVDGNKGIGEV